jgi:hypothetical protein
MRRKERLKFIAKIRAQVLAEVAAEKKREADELARHYRQDRERALKREQEIFEENKRHFAIYDACAAAVTNAETELFQNSPAFIKYQQVRRTQAGKKRAHTLATGNSKAP